MSYISNCLLSDCRLNVEGVVPRSMETLRSGTGHDLLQYMSVIKGLTHERLFDKCPYPSLRALELRPFQAAGLVYKTARMTGTAEPIIN